MENIFLTLSDTATEHHCEVMKRIAKDLAEQYKCEVIVRNMNNIILHREVYRGSKKEEKGCELGSRQIPLT